MRGSCTCCSTTYISYLATKLQRYFLCQSCFYNQKKKYHYLWFWKKMMLLMYITNLVKCRKKISLYRIWFHFIRISSVQFSRSVMSDSLQPHGLQHTRLPCPSPSSGVCPNSCPLSQWCHPAISSFVVPFSCPQSLHLILGCPLLLLPPIPPSIRVFSNESTLRMRWPKYWNFSFNISPSTENSGLISFRMDWLDILAVQGTLKSLLQHHSLKASILQCSAFSMVQLSYLYMTTA